VQGDQALSSPVFSWFTQELRRMQGIELVDPATPDLDVRGDVVLDAAPEWEIQIVVSETQNQLGAVLGYALSEVVLRRFAARRYFVPLMGTDTVFLMTAERDTVPPCGVWQARAKMIRSAWDVVDHKLWSGSTNNLRSATEQLVAAFDAQQLEPSRKEWEGLNRLLKKAPR
jgi:hypothetical protein